MTGNEPIGEYTWFIGFAKSGTFDFINISSIDFLISNVEEQLEGVWSGRWNIDRFNASGKFSIIAQKKLNTMKTVITGDFSTLPSIGNDVGQITLVNTGIIDDNGNQITGNVDGNTVTGEITVSGNNLKGNISLLGSLNATIKDKEINGTFNLLGILGTINLSK